MCQSYQAGSPVGRKRGSARWLITEVRGVLPIYLWWYLPWHTPSLKPFFILFLIILYYILHYFLWNLADSCHVFVYDCCEILSILFKKYRLKHSDCTLSKGWSQLEVGSFWDEACNKLILSNRCRWIDRSGWGILSCSMGVGCLRVLWNLHYWKFLNRDEVSCSESFIYISFLRLNQLL